MTSVSENGAYVASFGILISSMTTYTVRKEEGVPKPTPKTAKAAAS